MLSYRHAFHAGNHADVLKHIVLVLVLEYMNKKDKPYLYVDTHAGGGLYDLRGEWASKNREYETGIGKIWQAADNPAELQTYIQVIKELNPNSQLECYPGSPWLAQALMREQDRARLYELHNNELASLTETFSSSRQIRVEKSDGFEALNAILPPPSRRAVVLIDPPYEIKTDYKSAVNAVKSAYKRFSSGVYLLWYPVINRKQIKRLEQDFVNSGIRDVIQFELAVMDDSETDGMNASGMIVINPPWPLAHQMRTILPYLKTRLQQTNKAAYQIKQLAEE